MRSHWVMVAALLLAGCSADVPSAEASDAAVRFVSGDPGVSCSLLAPDTLEQFEQDEGPCRSALPALSLPNDPNVVGVEVAGESAQVRFTDQVLFLARFPSGWLVTAAGCERADPDPAVPYECEVQP